MPASSLLMIMLMLWSIPVLIYAILYFPELKDLVIGQVLPNNNGESIDFGVNYHSNIRWRWWQRQHWR
jgi:hypothetical protein